MLTSIQFAFLPLQLQLLLMYLLPKLGGRERTIGVFPTAVRCTTRWIRRSFGEMFLAKLPAIGTAGDRHRSVEQAVWQSSALAEHGTLLGRCTISILIDIAKAFENIEHHVLWQSAQQFGLCLRILRWLITLYRCERRLVLLGGLSEGGNALRTVVAGCSILMRLVLSPALVVILGRFPRALPTIVVDDCQITVHGPVRMARTMATDVLAAATHEIGELQCLPFNMS